MKSIFFAITISLLFVITSFQSSDASMIPITNPSFEEPVLADGTSSTSVPGWTLSDARVENPISSSSPTCGIGHLLPTDGENVMILEIDASTSETGTARQAVATVEPDVRYIATVDTTADASASSNAFISIYADGLKQAGAQSTNSLFDYETISVTWDSPSSGPLIGTSLEIVFSGLSFSDEVCFDNVIFEKIFDSDGDGVPNSEDQCPGFDDNIDTDGDGIPDDCDPIPNLSCGPYTIEQNFMCVIDTILATITLAGNVLITGNLQVIGELSGQTVDDFESRISNLETKFLNPDSNCSGIAACIPGYITANIDGDTLKIYGKSTRLALVDAPESGELGYAEASAFMESTCPIDSFAIVDEDDLQTGGSFGRIIGVVYCNGVNANEAILDAGLATLPTDFCSSSEFENEPWAQEHGC